MPAPLPYMKSKLKWMYGRNEEIGVQLRCTQLRTAGGATNEALNQRIGGVFSLPRYRAAVKLVVEDSETTHRKSRPRVEANVYYVVRTSLISIDCWSCEIC